LTINGIAAGLRNSGWWVQAHILRIPGWEQAGGL